MDEIKIMFKTESITTASPVNLQELIQLFSIKKAGAHLKYKSSNGNYEMIWPNVIDEFFIPDGVTDLLLVGLEQKENSSTNTITTNVINLPHSLTTNSRIGIGTGRRGNSAALASSYSSGQRAVPSFKRKSSTFSNCPPTKKNRAADILRSVEISDINNACELETIYEVPINLAKLNQVTVKTITEEIKHQVGGDQYILTNKKGNPIRDMPNTRGLSHWNNKSVLRAVESVTYKKFRPESWSLIKKDYDILDLDFSTDEDFDDFLPPAFPLEDPLPIENTLASSSSTITSAAPNLVSSSIYVTNKELKDILTTIKTKIESIENTVLVNNTNVQNIEDQRVTRVKECFKCSICLEIKYNVIFCTVCKINVGCEDCSSGIDACPFCRTKFEIQCSNCNHKEALPVTSVRVVGLQEAIDS